MQEITQKTKQNKNIVRHPSPPASDDSGDVDRDDENCAGHYDVIARQRPTSHIFASFGCRTEIFANAARRTLRFRLALVEPASSPRRRSLQHAPQLTPLELTPLELIRAGALVPGP